LGPSGTRDLPVLGDGGVLGAALVRSPKYKQLHEKKAAQCCAGDRAKLGDQDVRGKCRETNVHDSERNQPAAANDGRILQKLPDVVAALAPEDPEFVEQKMAGNPDEIRYRHGDQGRQKPAEDKHHGKIDQGHGAANGTKTDKFKDSLSIQHSSTPAKCVCCTSEPEILQWLITVLDSFTQSRLIRCANGRE
jgi:hypothetical protein